MNMMGKLMDKQDEIIKYIANECIVNNWVRQGNKFHQFPLSAGSVSIRLIENKFGVDIDYGYCFLDEEHGKTGLVKIEIDDYNPKWEFWMEEGELKCELQ